MRKYFPLLVALLAMLVGAFGGYSYSEFRSDNVASAARTKNYTDRGRICIEAAAMIRNGDSDEALQYLESRALGAIRGVPQGRSYSELTRDSQAFLVTARKYEEAFHGVDFELSRLTRNDVPDNHPNLSDSVRTATSGIQL